MRRWITIHAVIAAGVLAILPSVQAADANDADQTNSPPVRKESAPAKLDESAFRIVSERNIFNANRSGGTVRANNTRRPARVDSFALVGTMAYEKGAFAFFEGSGSEFTKVLKPGGVIAGYKLVDILANSVKLEIDGQITDLAIGSGLRREDQGAWKVSDAVVVSNNANGSTDAGNRSGRNDRWRRGDDSERNGSRNPETAGSTPAPTASTPGSNADQSEILKRLMERREKESQ